MPAPGASAKRYAQAAFDIGLEKNDLDVWQEDLRALAGAVQEPGFADLLENPKMPLEAKRQLVKDALPGIRDETLNLATILVAKGRLALLASRIAQEFGRLVDEHKGLLRVEVVTAVEMSKAQADEVKSRLAEATGKDVQVTLRLDAAIVGGMVIHVGDQVLDGSVVSKLRGLRRSLIEELA